MIKSHAQVFIFILLFSIFSCSSSKKQPFGRNTLLENKRWVLKELNGNPVSIPEGAKEMILRIEIGDNTFGGSGTCNTMHGMYTVKDEMINFHQMASTEMACNSLNKESEYFTMLQKANRYQYKVVRDKGVDKEFLFLYTDKQQIAKFEAVWLN